MSKVNVLVEVEEKRGDAFARYLSATACESEALSQAEMLVKDLGGLGLEIADEFTPIPMFASKLVNRAGSGFALFASSTENPDVESDTAVVPCEVDHGRLEDLCSKSGVKVWPNSRITLFGEPTTATMCDSARCGTLDRARSNGGIDCRPYRPAATIEEIRELLGVVRVWQDGFRGQNIVVGIIDEGVNGDHYPVVGGFSRPNAQAPGAAPVTSHGSMCAADVLVASPAAKIYDYPFLGVPRSGGALQMFHAALNQRRIDGTPHLTNNSYGFMGRPSKEQFPSHEIWDINHPLHRKVREVVASGAATFFSAGNCGAECPDGRCHSSGIGPNKSIHASNSLEEVITVAAVNSRHERIGYSSQGHGNFAREKPDIAAYSHFFGNFGPGRPAGEGPSSFDSGTSAASPVAAGVAALLLSAFPDLTPKELKELLILGATDLGAPGWDINTGSGIINAAASYCLLTRDAPRQAQLVAAGSAAKPAVRRRRRSSTRAEQRI